MAEVTQFAYGWVYPVLAYAMSVSGSLLGLTVATKARGRVGRTRARLIGYGAAAIGGVGVWLSQLVMMLVGLHVSTVVMRYDPARLAIGLGGAVIGFAGALTLVCYRSPRGPRVLAAAALLTASIAAADFGGLWALRFSGTADLEFGPAVGAVATATVAAGILLWFLLGRRRGFRSAAVCATVLAAALTATHLLATAGLRVVTADDVPVVPGFGATLLLPPVILLGCLITVMLWYFTFGAATRADLEAVFITPQNSIEIEPWVLADIRARIAAGAELPEPETIALAPSFRSAPRRPSHRPEPGRPESRRPTGWQPLPTTGAAWRGMPVWGAESMPNAGRPDVGRVRVDVRWQTAPDRAAAHRATPDRMTPGWLASPGVPVDARPQLPIRVSAVAGPADVAILPEVALHGDALDDVAPPGVGLDGGPGPRTPGRNARR